MTRYKITIEYDGTNYFGWQRQKSFNSIQEELETALFKTFGQKIEIHASGRTDAGVHALGQIAHFDLDKTLEGYKIMMAINQHIGYDKPISIIHCEIVDDNFHSRFDAKMRSYQYKILNRKGKLALDMNRVWHITKPLDLEKMREATKYLLGKHDFSSFRDSECQSSTGVRSIDEIKISKDGDLITIEVSAKSFLHHMIRNIVGTLYWVGREKISAEEMKNILEAKDRTKSGPNAPACGLYFLKTQY